MEILGVILLIVMIVLIVKFVIFIFTNWMISRILCFVCGGIALLCAFPVAGSMAANGMGDGNPLGIVCMIATIFEWLFYIGPVVFDVEWDGTYSITETWNGYEVRPNQTGGFIANFITAAIIVFIAYGAIGPEFPAIFFILPIGVGLLNLSTFMRTR